MRKFVVQEERAASCPAPRSRSEMSTEATGDGSPEAVDATEPAAGAAAAGPAVDQSGEPDGSGAPDEPDEPGAPDEPDEPGAPDEPDEPGAPDEPGESGEAGDD